MRYLQPLHAILMKSALLKTSSFADGTAQGFSSVTHVERREELHLLVSFDDSKWICDTLWKHFFASLSQDS